MARSLAGGGGGGSNNHGVEALPARAFVLSLRVWRNLRRARQSRRAAVTTTMDTTAAATTVPAASATTATATDEAASPPPPSLPLPSSLSSSLPATRVTFGDVVAYVDGDVSLAAEAFRLLLGARHVPTRHRNAGTHATTDKTITAKSSDTRNTLATARTAVSLVRSATPCDAMLSFALACSQPYDDSLHNVTAILHYRHAVKLSSAPSTCYNRTTNWRRRR
jgi:hypothetical protein